jgi:hypothetical protein
MNGARCSYKIPGKSRANKNDGPDSIPGGLSRRAAYFRTCGFPICLTIW